ncbi:FGGY-family carbohydrate kinase [Rhizobium sp. PAMB 3174]
MGGSDDARFLIGVDVGTGSARAGVFDLSGKLLAVAKRDIALYREAGGIAEQSSRDIWSAVSEAVREAVAGCGRPESAAIGIGFDATCSLVVLGKGGEPLPVGPSEDPDRNIIVWMDHRAINQAERINTLGHPVLDYVGGRISPEMETPKLLWLKENRPEVFDSAWQFLDLADFLTWKATGDLARSTCTVTCKWTYLAHENRWSADYFKKIGLGTLAEENFVRIGQTIVEPGSALGTGLTAEAAQDLGLSAGLAVGAGLIDAHAGGLGTVGIGKGAAANLGYVFGTSSCTMTTTEAPVFVPGVWGPYYSAMVPGIWLNEGGQSAAGAAIDQLLTLHPCSSEAASRAQSTGQSLPVFLADTAVEKSGSASAAVQLARGLHVVPEFLGNRAPFADPYARGLIAGLGMDRDIDSLVALYVAGICGIGYGLRQIVGAQAEAGISTENIVISGGAGQHPLIRQLLADACGLPVIAPATSEPVLLGAAMLGAVASGSVDSLQTAMRQMSAAEATCLPATSFLDLHARRYDAFRQLQASARNIRDI